MGPLVSDFNSFLDFFILRTFSQASGGAGREVAARCQLFCLPVIRLSFQ